MVKYLILTAMAVLLSYGFTPIVRRVAICFGAVDHPDGRKIHNREIPRLGGLAVVAAIGFTLAIASFYDQLASPFFLIDHARWWWLWLGAIPIVLVGVWDDISPLEPISKFLLQLMGGSIAIWGGLLIERISLVPEYTTSLGIFAYPVTLLWIVGVTNAFNLIDGLDGLSSGIAIIAATSLGGIALMTGDAQTALFLAIVCGALVGFLPYNFYPARIFIGDSGSLFLGFILSLIAIKITQKATTFVAVLIPLLVLGIPLFDTFVSVLRRLLRAIDKTLREEGGFIEHLSEVFQADQGHLHHILLQKGFSHKGVVFIIYSLGIVLASASFLIVLASDLNTGLLLVILAMGTVIGIRKLQHSELHVVRNGLAIKTLSLPLFSRLFFQVFIDAIIIAVAYYGAFLLKTDIWNLGGLKTVFIQTLPLILAVKVGTLILFGIYRGIWRYTNLSGLVRLGQAISTGCGVAALLLMTFFPYSISVALMTIDFLLLTVLLLGSRSSYRILEHLQQQTHTNGRHTLIYGAGRGGTIILQECLQNTDLHLSPVGFLDDDTQKAGKFLNGYPIYGTMEILSEVIQKCWITDLLIASEKISETQVNRVRAVCAQWGIRLQYCKIIIAEET
ncbi:MAG: hypothetical protein HZA13_01215 [Nitrospirae bacterium]|nr:hypothetical protein [Nitrospirota bacterium]